VGAIAWGLGTAFVASIFVTVIAPHAEKQVLQHSDLDETQKRSVGRSARLLMYVCCAVGGCVVAAFAAAMHG
jgi:hypothetical protein